MSNINYKAIGAEVAGRAAFCYLINFWKAPAFVYNSVDLLVQKCASIALDKYAKGKLYPAQREVISKACGITAGCVATSAMFGPIGVVKAIAMTAFGTATARLLSTNDFRI